jgi:tetratricopeptide (TPR) repeat protein
MLEAVAEQRPRTSGRHGVFLLPTRLRLATFYHAERRYAEAERVWRAALAERADDMPPATESDIHRRLADALEMLDRRNEAREELDRAGACLDRAEARGVGWHEARGNLYEQQGRFGDAATEYRLALAQKDAQASEITAHLRLKASLALYNAGRFVAALEQAEASLAVGGLPADTNAITRRRQMALLLIELDRLDEAEAFARDVLAIAQHSGISELIVMGHAQIGHVRQMRGDLDGALDACDAARKATPPEAAGGMGAQMQHAIRATTLAIRGDYDEAVMALRDAPRDENPYPNLERRTRSAIALTLAQFHLQAGRPGPALTELEEAERGFADFERLRLSCEAVRLWAEALADAEAGGGSRASLRESARALLGRLRAASADMDGPVGLREPLTVLARAAIVLGEYTLGLETLDLYAQAPVRPVARPSLELFTGECLAGLGQTEEARAAYRRAIASGIEVTHTALARERLSAAEGH